MFLFTSLLGASFLLFFLFLTSKRKQAGLILDIVRSNWNRL